MTALFALALSLFAAVVPTVLYVLIFYWADRYEREPGTLLLVAFFWGAIPAVIVSLISELALGATFTSGELTLQAALVEGALIAPIVEELAKALALWWLFTWKHNEFDGVLDGLVYGALIGFGFAMTEDFFYFIGAFGEGGFVSLSAVIVLRSVVFGLNHAFYTSLTGIGFGLARMSRRPLVRIVWIAGGLAAAMLVHSLHNLGSALSSVNLAGFALSLAVAVGGFSLFVVTVALAWSHERSIIRTELAEEVGRTLSASDYALLTGRWRAPLRRGADKNAGRLALFVELAQRKHHLRNLDGIRAAELLEEIQQLRGEIMAV